MAEKEKKARSYGDNIYVVKVSKTVSENGEIVVYADQFEITDSGALLFSSEIDDVETFLLALQANEWKSVHLGHDKYEYPVAVKRWTKVAGVHIVEVEVNMTKTVERVIEKQMSDAPVEKEIVPEIEGNKE